MNRMKIWSSMLISACVYTSSLFGGWVTLAPSPALIGVPAVVTSRTQDSVVKTTGNGVQINMDVCPIGFENTNYATHIEQHNNQYPNAPYTCAVVKFRNDNGDTAVVLSAREAMRQFHAGRCPQRSVSVPGMKHIVTSFYQVSPDACNGGGARCIENVAAGDNMISNVDVLTSAIAMQPSHWEILDKGSTVPSATEEVSSSKQHKEAPPKVPTYDGETDFETWAKKVVLGAMGYYTLQETMSHELPYFVDNKGELNAKKLERGLRLTWQIGLASENDSAWKH